MITLRDLENLIKQAKKENVDLDSPIFIQKQNGNLKGLDIIKIEESEIIEAEYDEYDRNTMDDYKITEFKPKYSNQLEENEKEIKGIIL